MSYFEDIVVRQPGARTIKIIEHRSPAARAIIINYPGYNGHIDGFNNKYRTLGAHLAKLGVGAFVQMPNLQHQNEDYRVSLVQDLRAVVEHVLRTAEEFCATDVPDIYLMGFSAGAGACAAFANSHPMIKKVLLMAPSGDASQTLVERSLAEYRGEVYIVNGLNDEVVGADAGKKFLAMAKNASVKKLVELPDCDHQFRGTRNGMIMSKAPIWAFVGDSTFPSPEGGIELY